MKCLSLGDEKDGFASRHLFSVEMEMGNTSSSPLPRSSLFLSGEVVVNIVADLLLGGPNRLSFCGFNTSSLLWAGIRSLMGVGSYSGMGVGL